MYNIEADLKGKSFLNAYSNPEATVIYQVESQRLIQVKKMLEQLKLLNPLYARTSYWKATEIMEEKK